MVRMFDRGQRGGGGERLYYTKGRWRREALLHYYTIGRGRREAHYWEGEERGSTTLRGGGGERLYCTKGRGRREALLH